MNSGFFPIRIVTFFSLNCRNFEILWSRFTSCRFLQLFIHLDVVYYSKYLFDVLNCPHECIYPCIPMHECRCQQSPAEDIGGTTHGCQLSSVGVGNQVWVCCVSHLSIPYRKLIHILRHCWCVIPLSFYVKLLFFIWKSWKYSPW